MQRQSTRQKNFFNLFFRRQKKALPKLRIPTEFTHVHIKQAVDTTDFDPFFFKKHFLYLSAAEGKGRRKPPLPIDDPMTWNDSGARIDM